MDFVDTNPVFLSHLITLQTVFTATPSCLATLQELWPPYFSDAIWALLVIFAIAHQQLLQNVKTILKLIHESVEKLHAKFYQNPFITF